MPVNKKQPRVVYYQPMKQQYLTPYEQYRRRRGKKTKRIRSKEESEETEKETTKPTEPSTTAANDPSQKPLTMNDLKKVLDEFGQRFFTLAGGNPNTATPSMFDFQSPPTGQINALNLAKNLQFPADDNIEWVRVKVPK